MTRHARRCVTELALRSVLSVLLAILEMNRAHVKVRRTLLTATWCDHDVCYMAMYVDDDECERGEASCRDGTYCDNTPGKYICKGEPA